MAVDAEMKDLKDMTDLELKKAQGIPLDQITHELSRRRLRDKFAMAALNWATSFSVQDGVRVISTEEDVSNVAIIAYRVADAMMDAREKK